MSGNRDFKINLGNIYDLIDQYEDHDPEFVEYLRLQEQELLAAESRILNMIANIPDDHPNRHEYASKLFGMLYEIRNYDEPCEA